MQIYLGTAGAGCLFYYVLILACTGKWNSTFSCFWLLCGGVHVAGYMFCPLFSADVKVLLGIILAVVWIWVLSVCVRILWEAKRKADVEASWLIILGAQVRGTRITNSLMRRLECGAAYLEAHPETRVIVSGGQGKGEDITEARAMAGELIRRGIKPERIRQEGRSTSTWENLCYSAEYIGAKECPVAVVTNDFHLYRAMLLARRAGYVNVTGIAASSPPVLFVNYLVREIFAVSLTKVRYML